MANENRKQKRVEARREQKLQKERHAENNTRARAPRTKGLKNPPHALSHDGSVIQRSTDALGDVREHAGSFLHQFVAFCTWAWAYFERSAWKAPDLLLALWPLLVYFVVDSACGIESAERNWTVDQEWVHQDASNNDLREEADAHVSSEATPVADLASIVHSSTPESDHVQLEEIDPEPRLEKLFEHFTGLASTMEVVDVSPTEVQVAAFESQEAACPSESDHTELEELEAETRPEKLTQGAASTTSLAGTGETDSVPATSRLQELSRTTTTRRRRRVLPALPDFDRLFGPGRRRRSLEAETRLEDSTQRAASTATSAATEVEEKAKVVTPEFETQETPSVATRGRSALPDLDEFFGPAARSWADYYEPRGDSGHDGEGLLVG